MLRDFKSTTQLLHSVSRGSLNVLRHFGLYGRAEDRRRSTLSLLTDKLSIGTILGTRLNKAHILAMIPEKEKSPFVASFSSLRYKSVYTC